MLTLLFQQNLGAPGVLLGSTKPVCCGDVAYIRLSNILDAPVLYSAFAKDHNDLTVDYVSPNALSQVGHSCMALIRNHVLTSPRSSLLRRVISARLTRVRSFFG